jgi:hypothetical protein
MGQHSGCVKGVLHRVLPFDLQVLSQNRLGKVPAVSRLQAFAIDQLADGQVLRTKEAFQREDPQIPHFRVIKCKTRRIKSPLRPSRPGKSPTAVPRALSW